MKRVVTLWCVMLLCPFVASAQTWSAPRPMDYADIFRFATLGGAELSPDGRWVVYEVSRLQFPDWQRRTDLYLVSADGRTTRQLTYTEAEDETGPRWRPAASPQPSLIGFISTRDDKKRQLFLIHPDGGEARRVTTGDDGGGGASAPGRGAGTDSGSPTSRARRASARSGCSRATGRARPSS